MSAAPHLQVIHDTAPEGDPGPVPGGTRPRIVIRSDPDAVRVLSQALGCRVLPETFVTDGQVVALQEVSGSRSAPTAGDVDVTLPVASTVMDTRLLARLLALHTCTLRLRTGRGGDVYEEEVLPGPQVLGPVLAGRCWPDLPPLRGMIGTPVLRPDGTLLQDDGYDPATGYYLASTVRLPPIPAEPTPGQVSRAREFLFRDLLGDFPWVSPADKANYVGLLATPILRPYLRCLVPFAVVDATMPGSGKTILTCAIGLLTGQRVLPWSGSEEELRKTITSVLADRVGVVLFDNIAEGTVIDSAILALLMTVPTWSDRLLGGNSTTSIPNNKLWMATGNNLQLGGDMASRTVWVRLDPDCPHPETRTGFAIEGLDTRILDRDLQAEVLYHLLVLILDWTRAGAPEDPHTPTMRQFTRWAHAVGGFCAHHALTGFLTNTVENRELDADAETWRAFLLTWKHLHGTTPVTAKTLRDSAEPDPTGGDRWAGTFPTTDSGRLPSVKSLGRQLTGQIGRWRTDIVLRTVIDPHSNSRTYWVQTTDT